MKVMVKFCSTHFFTRSKIFEVFLLTSTFHQDISIIVIKGLLKNFGRTRRRLFEKFNQLAYCFDWTQLTIIFFNVLNCDKTITRKLTSMYN